MIGKWGIKSRTWESYGYILRTDIAGSCGSPVPRIRRKSHTNFYSSCTSLISYLFIFTSKNIVCEENVTLAFLYVSLSKKHCMIAGGFTALVHRADDITEVLPFDI